MRQGKDRLAAGNITGATTAGVIALAGAGLALWRLERRRMGAPAVVAWAVLFLILIVMVVVG